jgi:hypothetical protein
MTPHFDDAEETPIIQVPETYTSIDEFDRWLHDVYIPATRTDFTECWGIFSTDGRFERYHHTSYITILTPDLENALRGKIQSHNHPTDSPFSLFDLKTWAALKMKEMRVITSTRRFIIKPRNDNWPLENDIEHEMDRLFNEILWVNPEISSDEIRNKCLRKMSEQGWFEYSCENFH